MPGGVTIDQGRMSSDGNGDLGRHAFECTWPCRCSVAFRVNMRHDHIRQLVNFLILVIAS